MISFRKKQSDIPRRRDPKYAPVEKGSVGVGYNHSFRRNRTLTGSTSNEINSVNVKSDLESPRTSVHHLSHKRRKVSGMLLVIFLIIAVTWSLISNLTARAVVGINDPEVSRKLDSVRYEKVIQDYLSENPTSRLAFLLNQESLTRYVANRLPEVSNVSERGMAGLGATKFVITLRKPIASWQINKKLFFVDADGIPFEQNYFPSPGVQIVDKSGVDIGNSITAVASKRFLSFVGRVVHLSRQEGFTVTKASLPANTTRQLEVTLKQGGMKVKLSVDRPAGEQVEDMVAAVKYFLSRKQTPKYIDVRVSGRAFYR